MNLQSWFDKNDNYKQVDADGATNIRDLDKLYTELQTSQRSSVDTADDALGLVLGSRYVTVYFTLILNKIAASDHILMWRHYFSELIFKKIP